MEEISIADLEAELGCFEPGLPHATSRPGHGSSDIFFDSPTESSSRLTPPSKTKSVYPFGNDGTLGWTTPGGELLSIASAVDNRLVGIEYKRSIERGQEYDQRGRMLERAVKTSQGSGYGIGLSLDLNIDPADVFWIHNRWPRYIYRHDGLEIRLQYYIESRSVIQQYQIRNNGQKDALLPYVITSDVCFREHQRPSGTAHPVPSTKCPERLLLIQNSEVLIRNPRYRAQSEMAFFLNGERQSLWADKPLSHSDGDSADSDDIENIRREMKQAEESIRGIMKSKRLLSRRDDDFFKYLYRRYYDRGPGQNESPAKNQNDFATYRNQIVVPVGSTQELSAVIRITSFDESGAALQGPMFTGNAESSQSLSSDEEELTMDNIWDAEDRLAARAENFSLDKSDSKNKRRISEFINDYIGLGEACSKVKWIGEARYHFHMAYLIAESFSRDDMHTWNNARFEYAEFLDENGWHRTALCVVKDLVPDLFDRGDKGGDITGLWTIVINRAASIFLKNRNYAEAGLLYEKGLNHFSENVTELDTNSAQFLERMALTQVHQDHNREAQASYTRLLIHQISPRPTILSNLAFIERRLRQYSEAKKHYESSLKELNGVDDVLARSGLSTCLRGLKADPEKLANVWPSSIKYVDVNTALSVSPNLVSPFGDGPFSFAIARQLESLLSVCSIPLKDDHGSRTIALMDADPLNCLYEGRVAYFQFRFLIQCQVYIGSIQWEEDRKRHILDRIRSTCEGHLIWASKVADSTNTWSPYYAMSGSNTAEELKNSSMKPSLAYSVEGAFHFLKLCLYLSTWREKWHFVLELTHLKLRNWLLYLERNQHMANLWIEDEDLESFKPYNSTSEDVGYIRRTYPHYNLSDAALVWLALLHVEKTIKMIEDNVHAQALRDGDPIGTMLKNVRQSFDASQGILSLQQIRSNILKTFKVPRIGLNAPLSASAGAKISRTVASSGRSDFLVVQPSSTSAFSNSQATQAQSFAQVEAAKRRDQQVIVLQRTINQSMLEIEPWDFATIEASILGIFEGSQDHVQAAWRETLNIQKEKDVSSFEDPRQIALTIFAFRFKYNLACSRVGKTEDVAKDRLRHALYDSGFFAQTIVDDAPESMRDWTGYTYETMSLLIGGLFKECRGSILFHDRQEYAQPSTNALAILMAGSRPPTRIPISMPSAVSPSSRIDQTNVVDTDFLPDWMYNYPSFIHRKKLEIDVRKYLQQLSSVKGLAPTIARWKDSEDFNTGEGWTIPFEPGVVDSGIKKRISPTQTLAEREISIRDFYDRNEFWGRLLLPRTPEKAKKRLIELSSKDKESVLICWLSASDEEKPLLLEFFRRHESSESFFGERAHWQGNVWETEFHLGFHELLIAESDDDSDDGSTSAPSLDEDSQRHGQIYSQQASPQRHQIKPVALSFRFVGDLRDRFWTCHFFTSVTDGFNGIVQEHRRFGTTEDKLHAEKQGQRKLLELTYVEKALGEMRRSVDQILAAFEQDLEAPETKDPANESFVFIHDYSSLYLEIGGKLRNVSQQLDASLSTVEQWERREEARGLRSRWSHKDEERHGGKLRDLTMKCKFTVQQLRVQQARLREQGRIADQRHSNLVSYKQLQEARTSTQSAADVRLFTYVTIIFLPLSFSSSLFSMAGAPKGSTIYVMVPTTAVALMVTFLLLANLKLMDRHWSFWVNKMNARTREQMKATEQSQKWKDVSRQLEETTQRRLIKSNFEQGLPAESNWWYIRFWLSQIIHKTRLHAHNGVRAWEAYDKLPISRPHQIVAAFLLTTICISIFIVYTTIMMTVDTIHLQWIMARQLGRKMLSPESNDQHPKEDGTKLNLLTTDGAADQEGSVRPVTKASGSKKTGRIRTAITSLITWLESSPRPIRDYINKMDSTPTNPLDQGDGLAEDTATLNDEATGSQQYRAMMLSLFAVTTSFVAKFLPRWKTGSSWDHSERKDGATTNGRAPETHLNGLQNTAQPERPEYIPSQPRRKRKLLRKYRADGPGPGEPRMWIGWSSV